MHLTVPGSWRHGRGTRGSLRPVRVVARTTVALSSLPSCGFEDVTGLGSHCRHGACGAPSAHPGLTWAQVAQLGSSARGATEASLGPSLCVHQGAAWGASGRVAEKGADLQEACWPVSRLGELHHRQAQHRFRGVTHIVWPSKLDLLSGLQREIFLTWPSSPRAWPPGL